MRTLTTIVPGAPAVSTEAMTFLNEANTDAEVLVAQWIDSVQEHAETYCGRSFTPRTLRLTLDTARGMAISVYLPQGPVTSITSVVVTDEYGADTAIDADQYYLVGDRLYLKYAPHGVKVAVTYEAGYETVPASVVGGLFKALYTAYDNREDYVVGTTVITLPDASKSFFDAVREVML